MFVLVFLLWMILNGRFTVELVIFGLIIAAGVTFFVHKAMNYSFQSDLRVLRNLPLFSLYILILIREIVKASFSVIAGIVTRKKPDPVIVEFDSGLPTHLQNVLLANSITLTPGTYTLFQENGHFVIHCLYREYSYAMGDSSFIHVLGKMKL